MEIRSTTCADADFLSLVVLLDADLAEKDGDDHAFYAQFNKPIGLDPLVAYHDGKAVACGAIKEIQPGVAEVKRMFTLPDYRGQGVATRLLTALEERARANGFRECWLETGKKQVDAVALYRKSGYTVIPNYGPYEGVDDSICFRKEL
ncbi:MULTISPECIES: GNAT family N-acetyltransferase [unclassified Flavobacterium]|uniref:GNAT family N-acetyltransferase n=1 Tax=unclassified Flavobacterium TaxID=196869 RepID=UPI001F12C2A0|nr:MULTISPECIES: GNAT family N-acetyltransferase [unclassified Flavobacterium]UMY64337.1 GNAT family N-acetyltransferase [Flavobacterium sp. HJ-32-4]